MNSFINDILFCREKKSVLVYFIISEIMVISVVFFKSSIYSKEEKKFFLSVNHIQIHAVVKSKIKENIRDKLSLTTTVDLINSVILYSVVLV